MTGDGTAEWLVLIQGAAGYPYLTQLLVLDETGQNVLWRTPLHGRGTPESYWTLYPGRDRNRDGLTDILLQNEAGKWMTYHWQLGPAMFVPGE